MKGLYNMENKKLNVDNRILYLDVLRIVASFAVMLGHASAQNWYKSDIHSFEWQVFNFYGSMLRWSVPVFAMISGVLFLEGRRNIKKHILRIVTAFVFWSILYALIEILHGANIEGFWIEVVRGHYHMAFLYRIVGLYLLVPFFVKIVESRALTKYFLLLSLIFTIILSQVSLILTIFDCSEITGLVKYILGSIDFHFTLGLSSYFVMGYYLSKVEISKKCRFVIYILSLLAVAFTFTATSILSLHSNKPRTLFYLGFTLNVLLESLGVFVFAKYNFGSINFSQRTRNFIIKLSNYSFGAFLVHLIILEQLNEVCGINSMTFNPILSVPLLAVIVFCSSYAISYLCHKIPVLNKYIV